MSRWFTNPLKELLGFVRIYLPCRVAPFLSSSQVFSRFLAPYVENLDMGLVNLGIVQGESMRFQNCKCCNILRGPGQVTLGKLRIKKAALDAFRLPVDVAEGSCHYRHTIDEEHSLMWRCRPPGKVFSVLALAQFRKSTRSGAD